MSKNVVSMPPIFNRIAIQAILLMAVNYAAFGCLKVQLITVCAVAQMRYFSIVFLSCIAFILCIDITSMSTVRRSCVSFICDPLEAVMHSHMKSTVLFLQHQVVSHRSSTRVNFETNITLCIFIPIRYIIQFDHPSIFASLGLLEHIILSVVHS